MGFNSGLKGLMNTLIDFRMSWKEEVSFPVEKPATLQGFAR